MKRLWYLLFSIFFAGAILAADFHTVRRAPLQIAGHGYISSGYGGSDSGG